MEPITGRSLDWRVRAVLRCTVAVVLLAAHPLYATVAQRANPDPIGEAFELRGSWLVQQGSEPARRQVVIGRPLLPGALIHPPQGSGSGMLLVVYRDGTAARFRCPTDCATTIRLKSELRDTASASGGRWDVIRKLFWGNPVRYRNTLTRTDRLDRDLIVKLEPECVNVAPALREVPHGPYDISLTQVGLTGGGKPPAGGVRQLEWDGEACLIPSGALRAGLYEVDVKAAASNVRAVTPFWMLVLTPANHEVAVREFGDAQRTVGEWPSGVSIETRRAVLRAALDQLAREYVR